MCIKLIMMIEAVCGTANILLMGLWDYMCSYCTAYIMTNVTLCESCISLVGKAKTVLLLYCKQSTSLFNVGCLEQDIFETEFVQNYLLLCFRQDDVNCTYLCCRTFRRMATDILWYKFNPCQSVGYSAETHKANGH